jgi:hypothetical protein
LAGRQRAGRQVLGRAGASSNKSSGQAAQGQADDDDDEIRRGLRVGNVWRGRRKLREAVQRRCIALGAASQPSAAPPVPRPPSTTHDVAPQRRRNQLSPGQADGAPPLRCSVALLPLPSLLWLAVQVALTIDTDH